MSYRSIVMVVFKLLVREIKRKIKDKRKSPKGSERWSEKGPAFHVSALRVDPDQTGGAQSQR